MTTSTFAQRGGWQQRPFKQGGPLTMMEDQREIKLPDEAFEPADDNHNRMFAVATINGTQFHVNAWRVQVTDGGIQEAVEGDEGLAMIHTALGADGHWETVEIGGEPYVLILEPFC